MANGQVGSTTQATPDGGAQDSDHASAGGPPPNHAGGESPRLVEERHVRGAYGEDELQATDELGRRWYHLRPDPRRRYDFVGFNYTWWIVFWVFLMLIVFLPWGGGWGY